MAELGLMFRAVCSGDDQKLQELLASRIPGLDLNTRCPEGNTMLHMAAKMNKPLAVPLLAGAGADVDALSGGEPPRGETPLLLAAQHAPAVALELLRLRARADLGSAGHTPASRNLEALAAATGPERELREQLAAALAERLAGKV